MFNLSPVALAAHSVAKAQAAKLPAHSIAHLAHTETLHRTPGNACPACDQPDGHTNGCAVRQWRIKHPGEGSARTLERLAIQRDAAGLTDEADALREEADCIRDSIR